MRETSYLLLLATLPALVPAQGPRLVDRIEAPLLYLSLEAAAPNSGGPVASGPVASGPVAGSQGARRDLPAKERASSGPVQRLLADPAFDALLGPNGGAGEGSAGRALALVRGVLARSSGDLEIALTGVLPAGGQPLLVLRARLHDGESTRLQGLLGDSTLAQPQRQLAGQQTWSLRGAVGAAAAGPGGLVELTLVGDDLLVANDATAMEELLQVPDQRTSATSTRQVLSADPRFLSLKKRLSVPPGSLLVYGDWVRLGQRLQTSRDGLPSFLLGWSGLGSARSVMASVAGVGADFTGTMLLDFDRPAGGPDAGDADARLPRPEHGGRESREGRPGHERSAIDGWLGAAQPVPARTLLPELPGGGLGGLVLAVDLADMAQRSFGGKGMMRALHEAFFDFGLDFERNVLDQLGTRGTVQLLFRRGGAEAATELVSVYSMRAKSRKAAADLFQDLRRAAEQRGLAKLHSGKEHKGPELLELKGPRHDRPTFVAIHEDSVLLAFDAETLVQVYDETRRVAKLRGKRDAAVSAAVQSIGGESVVGLFDLDFAPWFERIAQSFRPAGGASAGGTGSPDLSRIPTRHIGYLDLQPRDGGVVLRICVLSSL